MFWVFPTFVLYIIYLILKVHGMSCLLKDVLQHLTNFLRVDALAPVLQ